MTVKPQQDPVPPPAPKKNGRKGSTKARTGCFTCKARRIKCDETKPSCLRCVKTGRTCDGYPAPKVPRHSKQTQLSALTAAPTPPTTPSSFSNWNSSEQRAFSFYRHSSGTSLFCAADSPVWNRIIPSLSHQEPAIRHAVVVISHLHETRYRRGSIPARGAPFLDPFAAAHYGRALSALRQWQPPPAAGTVSNAVPLVACLLLVCIEFMVCNHTAARIHIDQGRQLLSASYEMTAGPVRTPTAAFLRNHLAPIFCKLSLSALVLGATPKPLPMNLRITFEGDEVRMPTTFETAADAATAMFEVADQSFVTGRKARLWVRQPRGKDEDQVKLAAERAALVREKKKLQGLFEEWYTAVGRSAGLAEDRAVRVAKCYYHAARIFTGSSLSPAEGAFDDHLADFSAVIELCTTLIEEADGDSRFVFDMEVMAPLYTTTIKCRHAEIRRESLGLLRILARRGYTENSWDAQQMANIAARIVALEEETEGEEEERKPDWRGVAVPEAARVRNAVIGPVDGKGAWVTFYRQAAAGAGAGKRNPGDAEAWTATREYILASAEEDKPVVPLERRVEVGDGAYLPMRIYITEGGD
ncbi:hypothetical protein F5X68DRAFT_217663 [Plectosphaerella plurivora]|uniref:Zn(2)-C6 fungal-type domain-containing protein n=1 Tax=Plectosphaerella plurivora TaxID=936078 RepID=A0A9P8V1J1_9PEZI|nr:hypothetical protein F5X68DRAFT_217663 [Plectosphaerella plurivora]